MYSPEDERVDGWVDVKVVVGIAYSHKKVQNYQIIL